MRRRQLSEASKKQRRDKMAFKKRGCLAELPEDIVRIIYTHVFVADGSVPGMISVNKAYRKMFMLGFKALREWIMEAKEACFDVMRDAQDSGRESQADRDELQETPEFTPNMSVMTALAKTRNRRAEALLQLKRSERKVRLVASGYAVASTRLECVTCDTLGNL